MISIQEYIDSDFMKFNFYELDDVIDYQTISTDDIQFDFLNEDEVEQYIMEEINPRFWPTSMVGI